METITIEYGTDANGNPQTLAVPKILKDEDGNDVDFQDILNKVNGKVKAVTNAELTKKYGSKMKELEDLQKKISEMQNPSQELLNLQSELEELKLQQLPEKERELARLGAELKKTLTRAESAEKNQNEILQKYQTNRIINDIQNNLPDGILSTAREDVVELLRRYASVGEDDKVQFQNIFEEGGEPLSAKDFNEKYFSRPEKAHYIASNLLPGTGTSGGGARDVSGKTRYSGREWQEKLASAKNSEERQTLTAQLNKGEVVITD